MQAPEPPAIPEAYGRAVADVGAATLAALYAFEAAERRLHPPALAGLRAGLAPAAERLAAALASFRAAAAPAGLGEFHEQLAAGAGAALEALHLFVRPAPAPQAVARVLESMRRQRRAQEALYPLRGALPPLGRYFAEPSCHERLSELDPEPPPGARVGLHRARGEDERGGFDLYVPERAGDGRPRPLVVALHGGSGSGRDFLWTWLREARSRDFLLLAPSSRGSTWSLHAPALDAAALRSMLAYVCEGWRVDPERILLTGLSDGATFALLAGLAEGAPYTALAPVSGVLHPASFANGNLGRARGRRIYLVHGALDWMFPVALARGAAETLREAGADVTYREIPDLSHTYPREENARILDWFAPGP